ncbi:translocation protein S66 [Gaertneriomyces sp. JEL0708]|nr:translocation protein S66 [Gaertneriomyces sp. JEL0708]
MDNTTSDSSYNSTEGDSGDVKATLKPVASFWLPIIYVGAIGIFTWLYIRWGRNRKAKAAMKESYFPPHTTLQQYLALSEMYSPDTPSGLKLLSTALMKRAMTDIERILQLQEEKGPLTQLVRAGSVGEDLLESLTLAEQAMNSELEDLMAEADLLRPGWSKSIIQDANQLLRHLQQQEAQKEMMRQQAEAQEDEQTDAAEGTETKETDEERRQRIAEELVREEENEKRKAGKASGKDSLKGGKGGRKKSK